MYFVRPACFHTIPMLMYCLVISIRRTYKIDQYDVFQVEEELSVLERKASLIEEITKENMEMQELARYP